MDKDSDWRDGLWNTHAAFFARAAPFATGIWSLPDGWRGTIETMLARVAAIVREAGDGQLSITGLRRRRGTLEVAWTTDSESLRILAATRIDLSSARAGCTCETCGSAARRYVEPDGVAARCDVHHRVGSVAIDPPWPLIRIERRIAGGMSRIVLCRIYDRERDAFVDVAPESLGIPASP